MIGPGGTLDLIKDEVEIIEKHFHNREKWLGVAAAVIGETHVADRMASGIQPFSLLSGNDDFGTWVQLLGSDDTPIQAGREYIDSHRFMVTGTDSTNAFLIHVVVGESADIAAKIAVEEFTEFPYVSGTNNNDSGITDAMSSRVPVGQKVWGRCVCIGANAKTINVYYGIHEYPG